MAELDDEREWPRRVTAIAGQRIKRYRESWKPKLSARALSDATARLGYRVEYQVIANMEAGRRSNVSVAELLVLGAALGVPPAMLVMPVGSDADVQVCPGRTADAWTAYRWFTGLGAESLPGEDTPPEPLEVAEQLNVYRNHDIALAQYWLALTDLRDHGSDEPDDKEAATQYAVSRLGELVARREVIRAHGWAPPALPPDIRDDVERAEAAARTHGVIPRAGQEAER